MNKQEIEKAICAMENLKYLLIDVLGNKNNEKEFDVAIEKIDELINKTNYELYKAGLEDAKDIILSQQKELATDNNVVTLSPEEAQELKAERDYWEREAKKWCAKLGEIRLWIGEQN